MGYICHHAIVVTGRHEDVEKAYRHVYDLLNEAQEGFDAPPLGILSPLGQTVVNGTTSFSIWPDGSKEGWGTSDNGDDFRDAVVAYLDSDDVWVAWCEVRFGDEADMNGMLRCSGESPSDVTRFAASNGSSPAAGSDV